jgi:predicted lipid-binding transport protein (Tim44 family)
LVFKSGHSRPIVCFVNIDFANHAGFSAYVLLLMVSGGAMLTMGSPAVKRQRPLNRVLNVLFGLGFFGYGFYLAFLFHGGTYVIVFRAFVVPVLLVVRTIRSSRRTRPSVPATHPSPSGDHYEPWTQQQQPANAWAAPQAPVINPWAAPTAPARTEDYSPSHAAGEPNEHE